MTPPPRRRLLVAATLLLTLALAAPAAPQAPQAPPAPPPCFGAAARDTLHPCDNPALRLQVVPSPAVARAEFNAPCSNFHADHGVNTCEFGAPAAPGIRTIALVGDSHASHWRAALDVAARDEGWHGFSVTRQSCAFSQATRLTPEPVRTKCRDWVKLLPGFLRAHPEIDTLFVSAITGSKINIPPGRTTREANVNGFRNAWRRLPDSVRHVVVIRDSPRIFRDTVACIDRAIERRLRAGLVCAVPRERSLKPDPQAIAARDAHSPRLQVVDLTRLMCSARRCFPVIGGALVFKDLHHFTVQFAQTLGPALSRSIAHIAAGWQPPGTG